MAKALCLYPMEPSTSVDGSMADKWKGTDYDRNGNVTYTYSEGVYKFAN